MVIHGPSHRASVRRPSSQGSSSTGPVQGRVTQVEQADTSQAHNDSSEVTQRSSSPSSTALVSSLPRIYSTAMANPSATPTANQANQGQPATQQHPAPVSSGHDAHPSASSAAASSSSSSSSSSSDSRPFSASVSNAATPPLAARNIESTTPTPASANSSRHHVSTSTGSGEPGGGGYSNNETSMADARPRFRSPPTAASQLGQQPASGLASSASSTLFGYHPTAIRTPASDESNRISVMQAASNWRSPPPAQQSRTNTPQQQRQPLSAQPARTAITSFLGSGSPSAQQASTTQRVAPAPFGWPSRNVAQASRSLHGQGPSQGQQQGRNQQHQQQQPSFASWSSSPLPNSVTSQVNAGSAMTGWTLADPAGWSGWTSGERLCNGFEEDQVVSFTWSIGEAHLLRDEVEHAPLPTEGGRSISAGAGKSEVWTTQPIFGDGKWKVELVRHSRTGQERSDEQEAGTTPTTEDTHDGKELGSKTTALSVYLTSMVLDYSAPDIEIPATVMLAIRPPRWEMRTTWTGTTIWSKFINYTFRRESEFLECHSLPLISEILQNKEVARLDSFALTVQISTGSRSYANAAERIGTSHVSSPFIVQGTQLVHQSLLQGLESLLDCDKTGDVVLIVRERGIARPGTRTIEEQGYGADQSTHPLEGARDAPASNDRVNGEDTDKKVIIPLPVGAYSTSTLAESGGLEQNDHGETPDEIFVRDRLLWAHSSILCARSDFFKVMLESEFSEGQTLHVDGRAVKALRIQDADFTTVYWLLRYLYLQDVEFMDAEDIRGAALDDEWLVLSRPHNGAEQPLLWRWTSLEQTDADRYDQHDQSIQTTNSNSATDSSMMNLSPHSSSHAAFQSAHMHAHHHPHAFHQPTFHSPYQHHQHQHQQHQQQQHKQHQHPHQHQYSNPTSPRNSLSRKSQSSMQSQPPQAHQSVASHAHVQESNQSGAAYSMAGTLEPEQMASGGSGPSGRAHYEAESFYLERSLASDAHEHPCAKLSPASSLALYRLAHRYHQQGLLHAAKLHLVSNLTPQSAFAIMLAAHVYEDLYSQVKAYVLDKWNVISQTAEFERCCDEVSAGEWGVDAGRALRIFMRSLVSPQKPR